MRSLIALSIFALLIGNLDAQHSAKAPESPQVVSIRFAFSMGMCLGYCSQEVQVAPGEAILLARTLLANKHCPDRKVRVDFSAEDWKGLIDGIDRRALLVLPGTIGCPGCADERVEGIEVRFSDDTMMEISYNSGNAPQEIKTLSEKLSALHEKLSKQLPPVNTKRCRP